MKKIFTLISVALAAMSVNAQTTPEVIDINSEDIKGKIETSIANPELLNNPLFILVTKEEKVFPAGTYVSDNYEIVTGGTPIALKNFAWEASTENLVLKANSTLNADATDNGEAWQFKIGAKENYIGTPALSVDGCDPKFYEYVMPKTGNPSAAYKDFYEYPAKKDADDKDIVDDQGNVISDQDGEPIHRILEPVWKPGDGDLPAKGCFYEFTAKKDGELKIAICLNKNLANNKLYIIDESTKADGYKVLGNDALTIKGFRNGNTFETESDRGTTNLVDWTLTEDYLITTANINNGGTNRPFYGYISFKAKANVTYMAMSPKSQLGLFGVTFTPGSETGISTVKTAAESADAPIYNLAGQKVDKSFKGIVIQNGKKVVMK